MGGGGNGESVSKSTTTRMINGKRQTVTERIVRKADGTVERHVEETKDDDFPAQNNLLGETGTGMQSNRQARAIDWQESEQQDQHQRKQDPKEDTKRRNSKQPFFKRKRRDSSKSAPAPVDP